MAFRENIPAKRENDFGLENALAGHVRRRWPDKTIQHVQSVWGLTESEASKVVYGHASKNVLNKILHHKRGGMALFLDLIADVCGESVTDFLQSQADRIAHEAAEQEKTAVRLYSLAARFSGRGGSGDLRADLSGLPRGHANDPHPDGLASHDI